MLLDAIIWLPTLFTYIVFLLILIILFFIVAYVSHKIYISIYDNLPLPAAPGSRSTLVLHDHSRDPSRSLSRSAQFGNQLSSDWIQNRSQIYQSPGVRVTLTLDPCYLISVELAIHTNPGQRGISFMCDCKVSPNKCAAGANRDDDSVRVLKYYDHLASVPRLKFLLRCSERNNMRLVLDDVIKDVKVARCTDSALACQAPQRRQQTDTTQN